MIETKNIMKSYGKTNVLSHINLTIHDGEVYGLIGKNGAGKTTLLNILAGIVPCTSGSYVIKPESLSQNSYRIGYLPDVPQFYDFMTGREYLQYLKEGANSQTSFEEYIDSIDLDISQKIKKMSRGNRQKLGIVAALVNDPQLLMLDEPMSALDPLGREYVMNLILRIKKERQVTILFSTHILDDVPKICDRIGILHNQTIMKEIDFHNFQTSSNYMNIRFFSCEKLEEDILKGYLTVPFNIEGTTLKVCFNDDYDVVRQVFRALSKMPLKVESVSLNSNEKLEFEQAVHEVLSL